MRKGKFIVIDGTDGSGKATQTRLLVNRLENEGLRIKSEDFPQYGHKSAGPVEDYLNGEYGTADELGAYIPSLFYAIDRFAASKRIRKHLAAGFTVVSNRYMMANMAHQGGKIKNQREREKYLKWLANLEYKFFKIPKPDLHIILHLPAKISQRLLKQRGPSYFIGTHKKDIHETDLKHLEAAEKIYIQLAKKFHYPLVEGFVNGHLLTPKEINEKVYAIVRSRNKKPARK